MERALTMLDSLDRLEELLAESADRPLLLFKHSTRCGVSAEAMDELQVHLESAGPSVRYAVLTVQTHRALSDAVSARLGIRHETPQVILIRDSRAVWSASHFRVNAAALDRAISAS
jgi:bacillithiol system protein YtxJ